MPDHQNKVKNSTDCGMIAQQCRELKKAKTRGELGEHISSLVLCHSPVDILQMKQNFNHRIQDIDPGYRDRLCEKVTEHLVGTWQRIRRAHQQGTFGTLQDPITEQERKYWDMVADQCRECVGNESPALRFLKYLLSGYSMFVLHEPGHPAGTPFPGGDSVRLSEGIYYCPVREKADDVDAALCPFCPALQTPEVGYLKPPVDPSMHRKQDFIEHCHKYHNFNG